MILSLIFGCSGRPSSEPSAATGKFPSKACSRRKGAASMAAVLVFTRLLETSALSIKLRSYSGCHGCVCVQGPWCPVLCLACALLSKEVGKVKLQFKTQAHKDTHVHKHTHAQQQIKAVLQGFFLSSAAASAFHAYDGLSHSASSTLVPLEELIQRKVENYRAGPQIGAVNHVIPQAARKVHVIGAVAQ